MPHPTTLTTPALRDLDHAPRWITLDDAARLACVTRRTITRWISIGLVRASRPAGGRCVVDSRSLRELLDAAATIPAREASR